MEVKRLRTLALEVFKAINKNNPNYMKYVFTSNARVRPNHFFILFNLNFYQG